MTTKELFMYLVDPAITAYNKEEYLDRLQNLLEERDSNNLSSKEILEEETFKNIYLPRNFMEVSKFVCVC